MYPFQPDRFEFSDLNPLRLLEKQTSGCIPPGLVFR